MVYILFILLLYFFCTQGVPIIRRQFFTTSLTTLSSQTSSRSILPPSSEAQRREEESKEMEISQLVGKHRKRQNRVYVWGFSYTGALGEASFVKPNLKKGKPVTSRRKYQTAPYLLNQDRKVPYEAYRPIAKCAAHLLAPLLSAI